jgi:ribose/xylose/arabinose/galactoside ABC-type transport system permease subunit
MIEIADGPESKDGAVKVVARRILRHENAVLGIVLGALVAVMAVITKGKSAIPANMSNVMLQSSIRGVASVGQAFVILSAGIDLSVGGVSLMCAILGAGLMTQSQPLSLVSSPWSIAAATPVMLLMGIGLGSANGALVSRTGIPPLIASLGIWEITKGLGFELSKGRAIVQQPLDLTFLGSGTIAGVPTQVVVFIAVAVVAYFVLNYTTYGRSVYAVGGNPISAWLSGINVKNMLFSVYAVSGLLAGLSGVLANARLMSASMRTNEGLELDTIASVVIGGVSLMGGRGNLIGAIIGVIIVGVINNGLSIMGALPSVVGIVKGAIIIGAVVIDYQRRK